jgi:hypothetical protein
MLTLDWPLRIFKNEAKWKVNPNLSGRSKQFWKEPKLDKEDKLNKIKKVVDSGRAVANLQPSEP